MTPYWIMFALAVSTALAYTNPPPVQRLNEYFVFVAAVFAGMIGLRHGVGGDWLSYHYMYERAQVMTLEESLHRASRDPGYSLLNWLAGQVDGGVYLVNFFVGAILMTGIVVFANRQPLPWLVLVAATPYLIIVIGMGYSRQAAAIGLELVALTYLSRDDAKKFLLWILLAALFHKSAVIILPFAALVSETNRKWRITWVTATSALAAYYIVGDAGEHMWEHYVERERDSSGALVRVLMNGTAGAVFLAYRHAISDQVYERKLYTVISLAALLCIPLSFFASTATDRVALYLIPVQLYVCGRINRIDIGLARPEALVVGAYFMVQYVWLNFASHAYAWLPYQVPL